MIKRNRYLSFLQKKKIKKKNQLLEKLLIIFL